jgi:DegV family protein with EDD domain
LHVFFKLWTLTYPAQKIKELDGKQLYHSFLAGAHRIFEQQKLLNKINVFPVADADTGTNLASTMRSIIDAIIPTDNPKQAATALADAALVGARGNSGIIFAQFLYGFSNEIKSGQTLDIASFVESMRRAVTYAYEAIAEPVEGTILTVIKDWAEYMYVLKDRIDDFIRLLIEAYNKALESLAQTTNKLEVLARAHVVDAGAKGFVFFLEGIVDFFTKGDIKRIAVAEEPVDTTTDLSAVIHDAITFRYCTEVLIGGQNLDKARIRNFIGHCGDSLVIAGSPNKMRIHIHTDFPAEVCSQLARFGNITYQKVDDMVMQNEILHNRKSDVAILTDSTCDIPKDLLDKYQIHMIPLIVHFGETYYLDRMTIQPQQFYSLLEKSEVNPSSAQPSSKDFQNKYEFLCTQYDSVIGVHITKGMSGTFSNSMIASRDVAERSGKKIDVINSKTLTGGLALLILRIAKSLENGMTHSEVMGKVNDWIEKSQLRVSVTTMKYIIRSGRVSPLKSFVARLLDLKPVICINKEGKADLHGKSLTVKGVKRKMMRDIARLTHGKKVWEYVITHANNPQTVEFYAAEMEKLTGKKPMFVDNASPALVANTGPGVVAVSLMFE